MREEAPDVLDVRVAEGEVVVAPVHPLSEADRPRELLGRPHDHVAALAGELGEAVLLDLPLRVEAELALDAHLDPEALAVEAVLVALVVAAERLVALEDVLQGAPPGGVHASVLLAVTGPSKKLNRGPSAFCARSCANVCSRSQRVEDLALERVVIGLVRQRMRTSHDSREQLAAQTLNK